MLKCPNCGAELPDNARFCGNCGAAVESTAPTVARVQDFDHDTAEDYGYPPPKSFPAEGNTPKSAPAKSVPLKKWLVPAIGAIVALIAIAILINALKPSKYADIKGSVTYYMGDDAFVFLSSGGDKTELDTENYPGVNISIDGTKASFVTSEDDMSALFYSDGGKPRQISEAYNIGFRLASSGEAVAFVTQDDGDDYNECTLNVYSGGKLKRIADNVYGGDFCISPDGKTVVYIAEYDYEDGDFIAYKWNGKITELGRNKRPLAVSNGGKLVYYENKDGVVYVQKGDKDDTKQRIGDGYTAAANRDLTQMIVTSGDTSYISRGGGERKKLSGGFSYALTPVGTGGVSNFADTFYVNDNGNIVRITGKFETETVVKSVDRAFLSDDGKTILYKKGGGVYSINGMKSGADAKKLASGVDDFIPRTDGGAFFYCEDGELFYQKGAGNPKNLGDIHFNQYGATSWGLFRGKTLYYIEDDELRSTDGGKVISSGFKGIYGNVTGVYANKFNIEVYTVDDGDYMEYISRDGKNFEILGES